MMQLLQIAYSRFFSALLIVIYAVMNVVWIRGSTAHMRSLALRSNTWLACAQPSSDQELAIRGRIGQPEL
jgi:hypothetical protein